VRAGGGISLARLIAVRNALTVALAAGVCLLDIGAALAAPPAAAPAGTAGLSNNYMFGWDVVSGTYRALAVDQYGEIYCNNCSGGGGGGGNAAASLTGTTVPTSADYLGFSVAGSLVGVSAANPLPISGTLTTSPTGTQAVSGTVAVSSLAGTSAVTVSNSPTVSLAPSSTVTLAAGASTIGTVALSSNTVTLGAGSSVSVSNFPASQSVTGTVGVSALPALPAGANAIGSVSVSNFPAAQTVNGSVSLTGSNVVTLSSNTVTLAAGASAIGTVALGTGTSNIGTIAGSSANLATYLQAVSSGGFSGAYAKQHQRNGQSQRRAALQPCLVERIHANRLRAHFRIGIRNGGQRHAPAENLCRDADHGDLEQRCRDAGWQRNHVRRDRRQRGHGYQHIHRSRSRCRESWLQITLV